MGCNYHPHTNFSQTAVDVKSWMSQYITHKHPDSKVYGPTWGSPGTARTKVAPCWPNDPYHLSNYLSLQYLSKAVPLRGIPDAYAAHYLAYIPHQIAKFLAFVVDWSTCFASLFINLYRFYVNRTTVSMQRNHSGVYGWMFKWIHSKR